jgi:hypothetical protein
MTGTSSSLEYAVPKLDRWTMRARVGRMERERTDLEHSIVSQLS